jgi:hypothetical protein
MLVEDVQEAFMACVMNATSAWGVALGFGRFLSGYGHFHIG